MALGQSAATNGGYKMNECKHFHGRVVRVSRLKNTANGYPRWSLSLLLGGGALRRFVTPDYAGWVGGLDWGNMVGVTAHISVGPRKNSRTIYYLG